jgi:hypothetical protein
VCFLELEAKNQDGFKTFMDSLNVLQSVLPNSIPRIWVTASALTESNSPYKDAYVKRLITASTNHRAVIRALNHPVLRKAVDDLMKIPLFDITVAHFSFWTNGGGCTVYNLLIFILPNTDCLK